MLKGPTFKESNDTGEANAANQNDGFMITQDARIYTHTFSANNVADQTDGFMITQNAPIYTPMHDTLNAIIEAGARDIAAGLKGNDNDRKSRLQ